MLHLLFDLDGTLTDSFTAIRVTVAQTLQDLGVAPTTDDRLRALVGAPLDEVFRHVLGPSQPHLVEPAVTRYRVLFDEIGMPHVQLFPGIAATLDRLHGEGYAMSLVTARGAPSARLIVHSLGLSRYFQGIHAPDRNLRNYDKANFVRVAMTGVAARPQATVMVGDRADDVRAGRAHGAFTIGVAWGNGTRAELEAAGAHMVLGRVEELAPGIEALRATV